MDKVLEHIDEKLEAEYREIKVLEGELRVLRTLFTLIENESSLVTADDIKNHIGICDKCGKYMVFNECFICMKRVKRC